MTFDSVGNHKQNYLLNSYETIIVAHALDYIQLYELQVNPKGVLTVHFHMLTISL